MQIGKMSVLTLICFLGNAVLAVDSAMAGLQHASSDDELTHEPSSDPFDKKFNLSSNT